ncbi:MAG: XdhC family protein [Pseudomonadota bacterium]
MSLVLTLDASLAEVTASLQAREEPFALATVVRTLGSTAAKPGTKALLSAEGEIINGWLGGGCIKAAVRKAAVQAISDGQPRLISVAPKEEISTKNRSGTAERDGIHYARNGCPSKGTIDIFIEPSLPMPDLVIYGTSPVAKALARLAATFDWDIKAGDPARDLEESAKQRFIVVATQGAGDRDALRCALHCEAEYIGFIGSVAKFASVSAKLVEAGESQHALDQVSSPAGLHIGARTPDEIALSVLAELTARRRGASDV